MMPVGPQKPIGQSLPIVTVVRHLPTFGPATFPSYRRVALMIRLRCVEKNAPFAARLLDCHAARKLCLCVAAIATLQLVAPWRKGSRIRSALRDRTASRKPRSLDAVDAIGPNRSTADNVRR